MKKSRALLTFLAVVWQSHLMAAPTRAAPELGKRARNRAVVEAQILTVARQHLATQGAAALSLRAIARDLGMVSSGIYRYVESRDELLTRLIVDSYTSMTHAVRAARHRVPRGPRGSSRCRSRR